MATGEANEPHIFRVPSHIGHAATRRHSSGAAPHFGHLGFQLKFSVFSSPAQLPLGLNQRRLNNWSRKDCRVVMGYSGFYRWGQGAGRLYKGAKGIPFTWILFERTVSSWSRLTIQSLFNLGKCNSLSDGLLFVRGSCLQFLLSSHLMLCATHDHLAPRANRPMFNQTRAKARASSVTKVRFRPNHDISLRTTRAKSYQVSRPFPKLSEMLPLTSWA